MEEVKSTKGSIKTGTIWGILLIAIGSLILVDNFDIINIHWQYVLSWQVVLIVVGMFLLCDKNSRTVGYVLIAAGAFFLLPKFITISDTLRKLFWPSLLIILGCMLIWGKRTRKAKAEEAQSNNQIYDFTLFARSWQAITSQHITGGKITCIFGSSTINLLGTKLSSFNENRIRVLCLFGGSKIVVPPSWQVKIVGSSIVGSITDKRTHAPQDEQNTQVLIVKGAIIAGNCEII